MANDPMGRLCERCDNVALEHSLYCAKHDNVVVASSYAGKRTPFLRRGRAEEVCEYYERERRRFR